MRNKYLTALSHLLFNIGVGILGGLILATILVALSGCGTKFNVSGNTTHKVEGTATIRVEADFPMCERLPEADRAACVQAIIDLLTKSKEGTEA